MDLYSLQKSFQGLIVSSQGSDIEDRFRKSTLSSELLGSDKMPDNFERFSIYRDMYLMRMEEALSADFPCYHLLRGDEGFQEDLISYTNVHPSTSFTLDDFGRYFVEFVSSKASPQLAEIAKFEWLLTSLFDEEEPQGLDFSSIAVMPPVELLSAKFQRAATAALFTSNFQVNRSYEAYKTDQVLEPERGVEYTLISIVDTFLYRVDLGRKNGRLLEALFSGGTLIEFLERDSEDPFTPEQIGELFQTLSGYKAFSSLS